MDNETKEMLQQILAKVSSLDTKVSSLEAGQQGLKQELSEVKQLATNINQRLIKVEAVQDYELKWLDKIDQRLQIQELT